MRVSIIGLGYVGYPLALQAAIKGFNVIGVDKDKEKNEQINNGIHPIVDTYIKKIKTIGFKAQFNIEESDIYIVCVPTPVDDSKKPNLDYVKSAANEIARIINDEQLVIIESTINPGVSEEIILPILSRSGKNFGLAHCPERINPGDPKWDVSNIPRVLGGINSASTEKAADFYSKIIDAPIMKVSQIKAAEATKILENAFRDINIAFINEMAQSFYYLDIDIIEVIKGASTKPFAFMPHYPGVGVGGHCIAVDPYYMIEKGKEVGFHHDFLSLARRINSSMPTFTFEIIQNALNNIKKSVNGATVTVLGLAYKPNVADDRESPSYELIKLLEAKGAKVKSYDPYFILKSTIHSVKDAIKGTDCVVIATAHNEFIEDIEMYKGIQVLVDGRNCLDKEKVEGLGIKYVGIGRR